MRVLNPETLKKINPEKICWDCLSVNSKLTPEFIKEHINASWNWARLSCNEGITPEFILETKSYPWVWGFGGLSCNPIITEQLILQTLDKPWYIRSVKRHIDTTNILQTRINKISEILFHVKEKLTDEEYISAYNALKYVYDLTKN